ncbi:hypothetical protein DM806_15865 [Sphingobium lactosutens]|uniref:hypothetical protein n=1 Tax=Sphingobium lactosutens TaxID=522773 RepID=UPI0015BF59FB|nr:hypothetical protein [Sphingobium lactosutens]NWK97118.1 hypothetical protein [Sphingobium lactosutens]
MDDYVSRTELSPVDRTVVRAPSPAPVVQPVAASSANDSLTQDRKTSVAQPALSNTSQELASVAEYVEVHARIAEILADLSAGATDVDGAAGAIQTMIPRPMVLVPLPPASKEAVEHAAVLAKRIVERASYAHVAQAHLARGTVEQIASSNG